MRFLKSLTKSLAASLVLAVGLTACASSATMDDMATAQAQIRVLNDTPERFVTVSLEDDTGNLIPLGNVSSGDTETFIMPVNAQWGEYQLVAEGPDNMGSEIVVSDAFMSAEGMTVNWFIDENTLEVN